MHLHSLLFIFGGWIIGLWFQRLLKFIGPNLTVKEHGAAPVRWWATYLACYLIALTLFGTVASFWHYTRPLPATMLRNGRHELAVASVLLAVGLVIHVRLWRQYPGG